MEGRDIKELIHLSTDFQYQKLYPRLVSELAKEKIRQSVFIQHRGSSIESSEYIVAGAQVKVSYAYRAWMKVLFGLRTNAMYSELKNSGLITDDAIIMAHFLMTDGAVAYKAFREFGTRYIVSVRNSDVNHYLRFRPWLKPIAKEIFRNASFIIFVSPSYIEKIKSIFGVSFYASVIEPKLRIIGNIIDSDWLDFSASKYLPEKSLKLLYFGEFSKNKRIKPIIHACDILADDFEVELTLIGNYGDDCSEIRDLACVRDNVRIIDKIEDVKTLISVVDAHDIFVMPSAYETFGMAYVEALSRGLPIIYSKGQGIDGYVSDGEVGYSVTPPIASDIAKRVNDIVCSFPTLSQNAISKAEEFRGDKVVEQYMGMLSSID